MLKISPPLEKIIIPACRIDADAEVDIVGGEGAGYGAGGGVVGIVDSSIIGILAVGAAEV